MRIAVQKDSTPFWKLWDQEIRNAGHESVLINLRQKSGFKTGMSCDGIMWHIGMSESTQTAASSILASLEIVGGKCVFPNYNTRWHFDNKVSQAYLFLQSGIETPETNVFWDENEAINWVDNYCSFPKVAKLRSGAASSAVYILKNKCEAKKYIRKMFSCKGLSGETGGAKKSSGRIARVFLRNAVLHLPGFLLSPLLKKRPKLRDVRRRERGYAYFQDFVPGNDFDTRVTVIGNRAFAFRRYNRDNDFRASGSGQIDYGLEGISMDMVRIAHEVSYKNNFQSMAYDFLVQKNGEPTIVEISFGYQSKAVYDCEGHWDRDLNWIEGHLHPEKAHVEDFINEIGRSKKEYLPVE